MLSMNSVSYVSLKLATQDKQDKQQIKLFSDLSFTGVGIYYSFMNLTIYFNFLILIGDRAIKNTE